MSIFSQGPTGKLYSAIAPDVRSLAMMIGKAFEAQTGIGVVNAILHQSVLRFSEFHPLRFSP
ncbi:MAG: hypothetical protein JKX97_07690 [Candidatus Lindowbacteria bacterium]|nr:hypothetical protein [Candidatus Lindowbacteria bacterium]